jgi:hypothetical protein
MENRGPSAFSATKGLIGLDGFPVIKQLLKLAEVS